MTFAAVENALHEGKKIKLVGWKNAYWYMNQEGVLMNHFEDTSAEQDVPTNRLFPSDLMWVMKGDWEVVEENGQQAIDSTAVPVPNFSFSVALDYIKEGKKVAREGWNGKGMFLFLADDIEFSTPADLSCVQDMEGDLTGQSIVLKTADNKFVVGWLASQTDMLADDWNIVE